MGGLNGGRYVKCDICNETTFSINLPWPRDGETLMAAEEAGWLISPLHHVCPACREREKRS